MHIYDQKEYGTVERIKEFLDEKKLTQRKLAELIGVDIKTVNSWMGKRSNIRKKNLQSIAEIMNCDVEFLTCEQPYPRKKESKKFKLPPIDKTFIYLDKLQSLMENTSNSFEWSYDPNPSYERYEDIIIKDDMKYFVEDVAPQYVNEEIYNITFKDGTKKKMSSDEIKIFVKEIMKYISFSVEQLKE